MKSAWTLEQLQPYVGRSFVIKKTRYGELDGKVGLVTRAEIIPGFPTNVPMLIVDVQEFPAMAMMLPEQFAAEIK